MYTHILIDKHVQKLRMNAHYAYTRAYRIYHWLLLCCCELQKWNGSTAECVSHYHIGPMCEFVCTVQVMFWLMRFHLDKVEEETHTSTKTRDGQSGLKMVSPIEHLTIDRLRYSIVIYIFALGVQLQSSYMKCLKALTKETTMESRPTVHSPSYTEAKKMKPLTLHTHGCSGLYNTVM